MESSRVDFCKMSLEMELLPIPILTEAEQDHLAAMTRDKLCLAFLNMFHVDECIGLVQKFDVLDNIQTFCKSNLYSNKKASFDMERFVSSRVDFSKRNHKNGVIAMYRSLRQLIVNRMTFDECAMATLCYLFTKWNKPSILERIETRLFDQVQEITYDHLQDKLDKSVNTPGSTSKGSVFFKFYTTDSSSPSNANSSESKHGDFSIGDNQPEDSTRFSATAFLTNVGFHLFGNNNSTSNSGSYHLANEMQYECHVDEKDAFNVMVSTTRVTIGAEVVVSDELDESIGSVHMGNNSTLSDKLYAQRLRGGGPKKQQTPTSLPPVRRSQRIQNKGVAPVSAPPSTRNTQPRATTVGPTRNSAPPAAVTPSVATPTVTTPSIATSTAPRRRAIELNHYWASRTWPQSLPVFQPEPIRNSRTTLKADFLIKEGRKMCTDIMHFWLERRLAINPMYDYITPLNFDKYNVLDLVREKMKRVQYVIMPVCHDDHWILLRFSNQEVSHYCPLHNPPSSAVRSLITAYGKRTMEVLGPDVPRQSDTMSCGQHVALMILSYLTGNPWTVEQAKDDIPSFWTKFKSELAQFVEILPEPILLRHFRRHWRPAKRVSFEVSEQDSSSPLLPSSSAAPTSPPSTPPSSTTPAPEPPTPEIRPGAQETKEQPTSVARKMFTIIGLEMTKKKEEHKLLISTALQQLGLSKLHIYSVAPRGCQEKQLAKFQLRNHKTEKKLLKLLPHCPPTRTEMGWIQVVECRSKTFMAIQLFLFYLFQKIPKRIRETVFQDHGWKEDEQTPSALVRVMTAAGKAMCNAAYKRLSGKSQKAVGLFSARGGVAADWFEDE